MQTVSTDRTNLCTNPSFETNTTSWSSFDATIVRSSAEAYSGTYSLKTTVTTGGGVAQYSVTGATIGVDYVASVKVKGTAGDLCFIQLYTLTSGSYTQITLTGGWDTLTSVPTAAIATSGTVEIGLAAVGDVYIDTVMFEQQSAATEYFDGDSVGGAWTGTAHASTSTFSSWIAESFNSYRNITQTTSVSWKKGYLASIVNFTIGTSIIGGTDVMPYSGSTPTDWNRFDYFDESDYVTDVEYERALNLPVGGVSRAVANVRLDNTSQRFTPEYMRGNSELFTALLPRRPIQITGGFNFDGIDSQLYQFVGITEKSPSVKRRTGYADIQAYDFVDFLQNRYIDDTIMFTSQRSDQIIERLLTDLNFATAAYELDLGINYIDFGYFDAGTKFSDAIHKIVQAENGQFYQDEQGKFRFENRTHYQNSPHFNVQRILPTSMVIDSEMAGEENLINVVEVKAQTRKKQPYQLLWSSQSSIEVASGDRYELFASFDDPVLQADSPRYLANTSSDGTGTDVTSYVTVQSNSVFTKAQKVVLKNNYSGTVFIRELSISGRPAKVVSDIYYREQRDLSVTAYEERPYKIENEYIQTKAWAKTLAGQVLTDFAFPDNVQTLTIRALPELQLGDLISWQGGYWRVYGIKAKVSSSEGYTQELKLIQRNLTSYFRIGISSIDAGDGISP